MRTLLRGSALALALMFLLSAVSAQPTATPVAEGLNGPMGLLIDPDGNLWIVDSGTGGDAEIEMTNPETGEAATMTVGDTSRVLRVAPDGTQTEVAVLPSLFTGREASGGSRLALLDGVLYVTSGGWLGDAGPEPMPLMAVVARVEESGVTPVADTWSFEAANNPDGFILESHPYGLAAGPDGMLYVADAGANTLLKVDPATGAVSLVVTFGGVAGPLPNPARGGALEMDPVPTGVVVDADGTAYVSFLPGFPFVPGAAKVVRVAPDGAVSDYATGFTMLTDLQRGPDGQLYAVQLGQFTEEGPVPGSGALWRVREGEASEMVLEGLSFPTAVAFDAAGNAYLTVNGAGGPGGAVHRYDGIAAGQ